MITNIEKEVENIVYWIKNHIKETGASGVVIGNSGGKDSAVVIALVTKAIGKEKVLTIAMPCNSTAKDLDDAKAVADKFEVPMLEIELTDVYNELEEVVNNELKNNNIVKEISEEGKINVKPRLRMTTLYSIAQTLNYLVVGTGNRCEIFVGYTTKWGDSASDFNPIADYTVEEVLQIGEYLGVPETIIKKSPSDGLGSKTDEEKMGVTYKQITEYIETNQTDEEAMKKIENMHKKSEHKRKPISVYKRNG
ncbi:MAG: NAD(+) synthase [Clostridiales bacterium]|nr:NAD(+) synthase [Clostridiales bacterium]